METIESSLKIKEVISYVASGRAGFGLHQQWWWSKETTKNKRRIVSEEIHLTIAVAQPKQGAWTRLENTNDRTITWSNIKQMEPKQLGFLIKAVHDILPTPVNLKPWGLSISNFCKACGKIANLKHVLTGCQYFLRSYTWRYNEILGIIAEIAKMSCETANKISYIKTSIKLIKEENVTKTPHRNNRYKPTLLEHRLACYYWRRLATRFSYRNNINSPVSRSYHLVS